MVLTDYFQRILSTFLQYSYEAKEICLAPDGQLNRSRDGQDKYAMPPVQHRLCRHKNIGHTGCFRKSSPPKTFWNIFTLVKSFCVNFCKFVGIYHFYRFIFNMSSNGINFSTSTHRFHAVKFWVGLFTQKMKMQLFRNDVIFRHRVSQCPIIIIV